jgi:hypothetical protein
MPLIPVAQVQELLAAGDRAALQRSRDSADGAGAFGFLRRHRARWALSLDTDSPVDCPYLAKPGHWPGAACKAEAPRHGGQRPAPRRAEQRRANSRASKVCRSSSFSPMPMK